MLELEGLGEYNNAGALLGLDGADDELLGALRSMNPIQRQKAINKLAGGTERSRGSRAEMEKHFSELPPHIKEGLVKGELRLADTVIYSIKKVASKTVKLFETQDTKQIGTTSLSSARLPKNQAMLVSGIIILAGVPFEATPDKIMAATYDKIESFPAIATGEFSLKANKKIIIPETSMKVFKTANNNNVPMGYYKLANPRLIHDDILIEATVELGTMDGLDPKTHLYIGLHGTITTP
ncbi:MAG: hypothetical protein K0S33_3732 [Bacteroidetes bacterium]|nr:hypothetical protein [Bacteroidota bacterium]